MESEQKARINSESIKCFEKNQIVAVRLKGNYVSLVYDKSGKAHTVKNINLVFSDSENF